MVGLQSPRTTRALNFYTGARGIANLLHALDIGIRDIRQILNPLRDIRHALNRREVQAERPSRPEKIFAVR